MFRSRINLFGVLNGVPSFVPMSALCKVKPLLEKIIGQMKLAYGGYAYAGYAKSHI